MKKWFFRCISGLLIFVASVILARQIYLSPSMGELSREYVPYEFWMGWFHLFGAETPEGKERAGFFVLVLMSLVIVSIGWVLVSRLLKKQWQENVN